MSSRTTKAKKPAVLGYFIGAGRQAFGSTTCYRCVFCNIVHRTIYLAEQHEKVCPDRLTTKRRATRLRTRA